MECIALDSLLLVRSCSEGRPESSLNSLIRGSELSLLPQQRVSLLQNSSLIVKQATRIPQESFIQERKLISV